MNVRQELRIIRPISAQYGVFSKRLFRPPTLLKPWNCNVSRSLRTVDRESQFDRKERVWIRVVMVGDDRSTIGQYPHAGKVKSNVLSGPTCTVNVTQTNPSHLVRHQGFTVLARVVGDILVRSSSFLVANGQDKQIILALAVPFPFFDFGSRFMGVVLEGEVLSAIPTDLMLDGGSC